MITLSHVGRQENLMSWPVHANRKSSKNAVASDNNNDDNVFMSVHMCVKNYCIP